MCDASDWRRIGERRLFGCGTHAPSRYIGFGYLGPILRLLPPGAYTGEWIGDLCVPDDLYWVARQPVALAGMSYPGRADWYLLHSQGIGHVLCLTHDVAPYDAGPCSVTALRLQDLASGGSPAEPDSEHTDDCGPPGLGRRSDPRQPCSVAVSVAWHPILPLI